MTMQKFVTADTVQIHWHIEIALFFAFNRFIIAWLRSSSIYYLKPGIEKNDDRGTNSDNSCPVRSRLIHRQG
jgi:hypothetical protein